MAARQVLPWLCLLLPVLCILYPVSRLLSTEDNPDSQRCIQCHNRSVQAAMARSNLHWPFVSHQCVACHLADGAMTDIQGPGQQAGLEKITGQPVTQERLWRKRKVVTSAGIAIDHQVSISGLDIEVPYRFWIILRDPGGEAGTG